MTKKSKQAVFIILDTACFIPIHTTPKPIYTLLRDSKCHVDKHVFVYLQAQEGGYFVVITAG